MDVVIKIEVKSHRDCCQFKVGNCLLFSFHDGLFELIQTINFRVPWGVATSHLVDTEDVALLIVVVVGVEMQRRSYRRTVNGRDVHLVLLLLDVSSQLVYRNLLLDHLWSHHVSEELDDADKDGQDDEDDTETDNGYDHCVCPVN